MLCKIPKLNWFDASKNNAVLIDGEHFEMANKFKLEILHNRIDGSISISVQNDILKLLILHIPQKIRQPADISLHL